MKLEDFLKELDKDNNKKEEFQKQIDLIETNNEEEAWNKASEIAKKLGFDVDLSEFAIASRKKGKLSEEDLEMVSGGSGREKCTLNYSCWGIWFTCNFSNECSHTAAVCNKTLSCGKVSAGCISTERTCGKLVSAS